MKKPFYTVTEIDSQKTPEFRQVTIDMIITPWTDHHHHNGPQWRIEESFTFPYGRGG